ncbi:MAG: acetylornithine deacetylase [Geminicoccaceae bacterium]|nr:acetylornithine deacetylase [Geminicoccaceae bacterium]
MDDIGPTLEILDRLIGFDTVSANSNLPLIDHVRLHLAGLGVESELVANEDGTKANLLATIGPPDTEGIVLSGHTDVVPAAGQAWSSDPFVARRADERVYGRGAADMKGFVAVALGMVPSLLGRDLRRPVHLAFSYDEEVGCKGVPSLIDHMRDHLPRTPMGCIVGEPTMMTPVIGHKGKIGARCTVHGRTGHSALTHEAVNAVMYAGRLIAHLHETGTTLAATAEGPGFVPPHTSVSVGRIEGGSQLNIVPDRCTFEFEFRLLPDDVGQDRLAAVRRYASEVLEPEMQRVDPRAGITFEVLMDYPGFAADLDDPFVATCSELLDTDEGGRVSFGTEAGWFTKKGMKSLVCGPGDIAVAHRPDEYVAVDQLVLCRSFLDRLVTRLAT